MNGVAIFRRGAWLVAGALLFSVPSTHAVMDSGQQQTPDFGVIQFTDDEAFINLPVALSDAWSKTLEVLAAMNPAVKADLPYLENNGRIIAGDLWVAVETQGDTSRSWAHIRVAIPAGGGDAARTRAEILLDAIGDRLEPQKVGPPAAPPAAADQPALPPAAEGLVDPGSTEQQPVYNTYNYYYGSEPYSSSYAQPDYGYAPAYYYPSYASSYCAPWWGSSWNWGFSACWGNFCGSWGWGWGNCWNCNPWWWGCGWNNCWNSCGTTIVINNNVNSSTGKATVLTPRVTTLPGNNQGSGATTAGGRGPVVRGPGGATTVVDRPVRRAPEPSKPVVVRQTDRGHEPRAIVVSGTDRTPSSTRPRIVTTTGGSTPHTGTTSRGGQRDGPTVKLGSAPYGARVPVALPTHELDQPRNTGTMGGESGGGASAPTVSSGPAPANGSGGSVSYPAPVIRGPSGGGSSGSPGMSAPPMSAPRPAPAPAPRVDPPRASAPAPRPAPAPMPAPAPAPRPAPSPMPSMGGGGGHGSAGPIGGGPSGGSSGSHGGVSGGVSGGRPR